MISKKTHVRNSGNSLISHLILDQPQLPKVPQAILQLSRVHIKELDISENQTEQWNTTHRSRHRYQSLSVQSEIRKRPDLVKN